MAGKTIQAIYISYDGMTDPLGQSQVIPYLAGLSKKNIRFTLISFEKPEAYARSAPAIREQLHQLGILWMPMRYTKYPPVLSTLYDTWRMKRKVRQVLLHTPADVIHCRSYIAALVGAWAKKRFGIKFIFDMRGLWADERVDGKLWNLNNPLYRMIYRFFKKKETDFLREADYTISLTEAAREEILSWPLLQNLPIPIQVIPCCVDTTLFDPESISDAKRTAWLSKLGLSQNDFILSYVGSIGTWYMLDEMLGFFKKLKTVYPHARFLFITRHEHERIREAARHIGIADDIIIQAAERHEVPELLSLSKLSVFFILPAYSKMASSPTKQGEIMAMGIPVVCNSGVGDTDKIIQKYRSGYLVVNGDLDAGIRALQESHTNTAQAIRAGAIDYFSLESGVEQYNRVYRTLLP